MGDCKMCGKCCMAISLHKSQDFESIKQMSEGGNEDAKFILKNWVPISAKEVFKIRPEAEFSTIFNAMGERAWWKCTKWDPKTHKCTVHETRPKVCSGYPGYGRWEINSDWVPYTFECGYIEGELTCQKR